MRFLSNLYSQTTIITVVPPLIQILHAKTTPFMNCSIPTVPVTQLICFLTVHGDCNVMETVLQCVNEWINWMIKLGVLQHAASQGLGLILEKNASHTSFQTNTLSHKNLCIRLVTEDKRGEREREEWEKDREPSSSPGFRTRWTLQYLASGHPHWCQGPPALSWISSCRG